MMWMMWNDLREICKLMLMLPISVAWNAKTPSCKDQSMRSTCSAARDVSVIIKYHLQRPLEMMTWDYCLVNWIFPQEITRYWILVDVMYTLLLLDLYHFISCIHDSNMELNLEAVLKDFPAGPLDVYRKSSSFKWQDMTLLLNGRQQILFKEAE